jgi:hypothetical protein
MTSRRMLVIFAVVVVAFTAVALRTEVNQRQISRNQQQIAENAARIERAVWQECAGRNEGARRLNLIVQASIAGEQRRPDPDLVRIKALEGFKAVIIACGPKPP